MGQRPRRYLFYVEQNYAFEILRPIQEVLRSRGDEVAWLPVGESFSFARLGADERAFRDVRDAIAWDPVAVFAPGNYVPKFIPGVKVRVTHGLPSEKRTRGGDLYFFAERGLFDLQVTHGPSSTEQFKAMAASRRYFEVAECGLSKLDPLFDGSMDRTPLSVPVIYFASTFSPRLSAAPALVSTVESLLGLQEWHWLVHSHPRIPREVTDLYRAIRSDRLIVVEGVETLPQLLAADVMLCDTSSIISEFALLDKPVVTYRTAVPKPHVLDVTSPAEIGTAIEHALDRPAQLMAAIRAHAADTQPLRDGRASERIVQATDRLVSSGTEHLANKPRNLLRHWKMRRQLRYYGRS